MLKFAHYFEFRMTKEEIIEKSNSFFIDEFEVDGAKINPTANLRETLDLDSLDYVDLVTFGVASKKEVVEDVTILKNI